MPCTGIDKSLSALTKKDVGRRTFIDEDAFPHESSYIIHCALAVMFPAYSGGPNWSAEALSAPDSHGAPIRRTHEGERALYQSMSSGCSKGAWVS